MYKPKENRIRLGKLASELALGKVKCNFCNRSSCKIIPLKFHVSPSYLFLPKCYFLKAGFRNFFFFYRVNFNSQFATLLLKNIHTPRTPVQKGNFMNKINKLKGV